MTKTAKEVQGDVYALLRGSALAGLINGDVYRAGFRPRDSRKEDAVVIFTAGLPSQIQSGVVTVNIFVPDINLEGVWVEDAARTAALERAAQDWAESLTCAVSNYRFELQDTICTEAERDTQQHFVVVMLRYDYFDEV